MLTSLCEKEICILLIFIALWSILFCSVLSFPFVFTLISVLTLSYTLFLFLDGILSLFSFYCHFHLPPRPPLPLLRLCVPPPTLSPSPLCDWSFSWRCCSTASICPACCASPRPHQALGPSTHTKYFYLFIRASWR